ncbi:MAG TPA: ornithine carbamoyltransferase [Clostridia bacterium]|nr:ornithine carbamoyltransferase [Clostridia bacterium]
MEHFINFENLKADEINEIIEKATVIKSNPKKFSDALEGKFLYELFQKTSTRTALSFSIGMEELGGKYFLQKWEDSNFKVGEIRDEVRYIGSNVDIIMARLKFNEDINEMAHYSPVPVINGCCNKYHPCQVTADLLTVKEHFGTYNIKMLYVGVLNNVLNSLIESLPRLGGKLFVLAPIINKASFDQEIIDCAKKTGNLYLLNHTGYIGEKLLGLVGDMDVIYTDSWVDMEFFNNSEFAEFKNERIEKMMPFQLNSELLSDSKAKIMHDMPIHAGYEIDRDMIEKNIEIILQQAENRKHAQKAILLSLLNN